MNTNIKEIILVTMLSIFLVGALILAVIDKDCRPAFFSLAEVAVGVGGGLSLTIPKEPLP